MITDEQIEKAFEDTDFGPMENPIEDRKKLLTKAIFKLVAEYSNGHTMSCILLELGMVKNLNGGPLKAARRWAYHQYNKKPITDTDALLAALCYLDPVKKDIIDKLIKEK